MFKLLGRSAWLSGRVLDLRLRGWPGSSLTGDTLLCLMSRLKKKMSLLFSDIVGSLCFQRIRFSRLFTVLTSKLMK